MAQLDDNRLRQTFFILLIAGLGLLIFLKIYPFITALLGAFTFYVLFRKTMFFLTVKKRWNKTLSALLIIVLSFLIILLPTGVLLSILYNKLMELVNNPKDWMAEVEGFIAVLNNKLGIDILGAENLKKVPELLANIVPNILMATADTLIIVGLLYFVLYFMLTNGRHMENWLYQYIPLKDSNLQKIEKEIVNMVLSNAIGIPLLAVIQALFAFAAYWFLDVPDPVLWGAVTAFAAMLPVVGSTAIWFPLALYLYFNGQTWQGITLFVYGAGVIINIDNVFRMILQKRMADTHPLVTMFGVIIGVSLFGFIGLIFGPLLVSLFIVLLKVYKDEFVHKQRELDTAENK